MTTWGILFQLDVIHDYYTPTLVPIRLKPWGPTRTLFAQADTRLLERGPHITVACSDDRTGLLSHAKGGRIDVLFALRPDTMDFSFVTSGLAEEAGYVPVFDAVQVAPPSSSQPSRQDREIAKVQAVGVRPPVAFVRAKIDPAATEVQFEARFRALEMPWTYHVIGGGSDAKLSIRDTAGEIAFANLGARRTGSSGTAIGFRSDKDIGLRARPQQRFELLGEGPFGNRVIVPVLPTPRPGPTADIYVNLT
jgi:hypothetical protein